MPRINPLVRVKKRIADELAGFVFAEPPMLITRADGRSYRWKGYRIVRRGTAPVLLSEAQCRQLATARDLAAAIDRLSREPL